MDEVSSHVRLDPPTARPTERLLHLVFESHDGRCYGAATRILRPLRHRTSQERSPTPKLKREIAALLDVCIILGGGDGVLAHIRDLKDMSDLPPAEEFDRAARWAKRKLAECRRRE